MHALDMVHAANALSGAAFLGLGLWVASVRSKNRANLAFALYALAWAGAVFVVNLAFEVDHVNAVTVHARSFFEVFVTLGLVLLVARYPSAIGRNDITLVVLSALFALGLVLSGGVSAVAFNTPTLPTALERFSASFGNVTLGAGLWGALCFLALRWRASGPSARRSIAFISIAIGLWPAYATADQLILANPGLVTWLAWAAAPVLLVLLWLVNAARDEGRHARVVAWAWLAAMLAAMVERTFTAPDADLLGYGIVRLAGVVIIAYAIVRHQLLDIDVKVRWTLSKSTIAAAFIAVFFIASEAAQQFFGETLGSAYVGIAAAGALVFAIAPLQRIAEGLVNRALPVAEAPQPTLDERKAKLYIRLARRLRADGEISREDERNLAHLAQELGIGAGDALDLRQALDDEELPV